MKLFTRKPRVIIRQYDNSPLWIIVSLMGPGPTPNVLCSRTFDTPEEALAVAANRGWKATVKHRCDIINARKRYTR